MIGINEELKTEVKKAMKALGKIDSLIEVRMLKTKNGTRSGYYENVEKMLKDIARYDGVDNIFFTLNEFSTDLLARSNNKLTSYAQHTTSDQEIEKRVLILIDVDPERPSGISSTKEELESAKEVLKKVLKYLTKVGFPKPIIALSGNGYHALYKVDLPNTKEVTEMIKKFLITLDKKFSNEKAKIDKTTYNASRISKLYGTIACKGDAIKGRPHRRSKILKVPDVLEVVEQEIIKKVIINEEKENVDKEVVETNNKTTKIETGFKPLDIESWLEKYNIEVCERKDYIDRTCYVLAKCPWNENHTDKSASITQFNNGALSAKCHHDSCSKENWHSLREIYEPKSQRKYTEYSNRKKENNDEAKKSQADIILEQVEKHGDIFFHNENKECFVAIDEGLHYEVYKINNKKYNLKLKKRFYDEFNKTASSENISQVVDILEAKALYEGKESKVFNRCAIINNISYYDIGDEQSTVIKINESGWKVNDDKQIMFIRKSNMKAQVMPEKYENLSELLNKYFRFKSEEDRILHAVSLVTRLILNIPQPIEVIHGEKGSAKSTTQRMNRSLIDPASIDIISMPKAIQDLAISLSNNYMVCFDNLDNISAERSDLLCIASTGGGYTKRKLYTDDDEVTISIKNCISLNGINVVATRPDLLDRSIILTLERIPENERKEESKIWEEFNKDKPKILGAMFNALANAKKIYPTVKLEKLGRMADFTKWGYAVAESCEIGGEKFIKAYLNNQKKLIKRQLNLIQ